MKTTGKIRIVLMALAVLAAAVLFATYGTTLPAAPFAPVQVNGPSVVDSDGNFTVVADTESRRALIMNADGDLTGMVSCAIADAPFDAIADAPFDAITDVCVSEDLIFVAGARFAPDSDVIVQERVAVYDKGGNAQGLVYEKSGVDTTVPMIKALSDVSGGVAIAIQNAPDYSTDEDASPSVSFIVVDAEGAHELNENVSVRYSSIDAAFSAGDDVHYATLSFRGILNDGAEGASEAQAYAGRVFTSIDVDDGGTLYACDDTSGALCVRRAGSEDVDVLLGGRGYRSVHVNDGVISLCNYLGNEITLCDGDGIVTKTFTETRPSIGFSLRMVIVWASGIYLAILAIVLAIRKLRRQFADGNTEGLGPMLLAVAVVSAVFVAIGNVSYVSYQASLEQRSAEINMCADSLVDSVMEMGDKMEKANNRDALRGTDEQVVACLEDMSEVIWPAFSLVTAANDNGIGMYCTLYGRDGKGPFYLYGSSFEYVLGSSARSAGSDGLDAAFDIDNFGTGELMQGSTLRDAALYRFVPILSSDSESVVGVIEIGSKMRSFDSSLTSGLAKRIIALLVMILVVYLAYCELRACGLCMFAFRERRRDDPVGSIAMITRPFTLSITLLASIDAVMTVLIARDLLTQSGLGETSPLLAVPSVTLGIGLIVGQVLYGFVGSRVGLRKLMATGALIMLACACFTGAAVVSGSFVLYCVAKLVMSVPFGMLYALGYSLPRLASSDESRAAASGGVTHTDTSAAALGTVIGGYAAQLLGNVWVYALVAMACIPILIMALNTLPRGMRPLEVLAQPERGSGRIVDFLRSRKALALAFFIVLPATIAAGYASFLFPLFSSDMGLEKSDINNIVVIGQLVVYMSIGAIARGQAQHGKWRVSVTSIALLGAVFLLFAINTTLVWAVAVIALVALFGKAADGWKAMWLKAAGEADIPAGTATSAMFATRSLALIAQPFLMGALLGAADFVAVIVIGLICVVCAGLFYLATRHSQM